MSASPPPTEAAALGLMATLALVWLNGELTLLVLLRAFEGTVRTTSMVMLIVIAAFFLNLVIVSIGLVKTITDTVLGLGLSPYAMLLAIVAFYVVLGCFMETISMMIATTPVVVPVLVALGFDPLWWGVVFVILMEMALITPPVGLNLFVVQAVRGRGAFAEGGPRRPAPSSRS
ncbi:MAG: TRAP transporter large permease subunit [Xanthobacteraceae bacterium]|nr:TRAP transporter large permease subunit [Xanthobacteraceae bacterium]